MSLYSVQRHCLVLQAELTNSFCDCVIAIDKMVQFFWLTV